MHLFDRRTDRQTDGRTEMPWQLPYVALHASRTVEKKTSGIFFRTHCMYFRLSDFHADSLPTSQGE